MASLNATGRGVAPGPPTRSAGSGEGADGPGDAPARGGYPAATGIGPSARTNANTGRPFVYEELLARMRAVLRRAARPRHPRLAVGDLEIDLAARLVRVGDAAVHLSAKEFDLLVALADDPERVYRKEELLRDVWGFRSMGRTRTLDSHASRLRRKLNLNGEAAYVVNVWGVGYRLVGTGPG